MLGCAFREDIYFEVGLVDFLVVLALIGLAESVTLTFEFCEFLGKVVLLFFKTALDDLGSGEQTLLKTT